MAMDPAKLARKNSQQSTVSGGGLGGSTQSTGSTTAVIEAPAQTVQALPAPASTTPVQGERFTGLDPLTRSLIESTPLVDSTPARTTNHLPPSQPLTVEQPARRFSLKQPTVLVALGGTLAAGLLVIAGFRGATRRGYPSASPVAQASVAAPAPAPIPTASSSWLIAGGSK